MMLLPKIEGELKTDPLYKTIYSTDASAYKETPLGVAFPKNSADIRALVSWASKEKISLIPRGAGTSLAGQVVGSGLVVDVSRHMNKILELNTEEHWVRVEPGVVLDELNLFLAPYGLFFAPETSTSNRCTLGGMLGNNSCGSHSLRYGGTRDHVLEADVVLSDGSEACFKALSLGEMKTKRQENTLEGRIMVGLLAILEQKALQKEIVEEFPDPRLTRRNNGYALDQLLLNSYFDPTSQADFNLAKLLAGSEGTLAFATQIKLNLEPLPPQHKALICVHTHTLDEALYGNLVAREHGPVAIELMDHTILELARQNISQLKNSAFVEGSPAAILIIELVEASEALLDEKIEAVIAHFKAKGFGYAFPCIKGESIKKVWALRKAGLGLLANMRGDAKPVSVIEDTAVIPERLPDYIHEVDAMLKGMGLSAVYHAHIGTGELHIRPVLNLKDDLDIQKFRTVAKNTALLVKKYRGSLSGEHGDGRLRGEFLPIMLGNHIYEVLVELKNLFDPQRIFNEGKIVETPAMNEHLKLQRQVHLEHLTTNFNFDHEAGWIQAVERCNGSADCRKSPVFGGGMCPSFRASGEEEDTTRARANILRELMYKDKALDFNDTDVLFILHNCLSCKACKSECPSSVDMTRLKAEYLQHHFDKHGVPLATNMVGHMPSLEALASVVPRLYNGVVSWKPTATLLKGMLGFAQERAIPKMGKVTLKHWLKKHKQSSSTRQCYLFVDEFTNFLDVEVGQEFVLLLNALGYEVLMTAHKESGRTALSKGLVRTAKKYALQNVHLLKDVVTKECPLVGLEPSTLLTFRDEYPDLVPKDEKADALNLGKNVLLYDEFIEREIKAGHITADAFTTQKLTMILHGHCHQKSLASVAPSKLMLELPKNYSVRVIDNGCCGMAGAYGYEKKHYKDSIAIGKQALAPILEETDERVQVVAPGTSCRTQIKDVAHKTALHPVQVLYRALK